MVGNITDFLFTLISLIVVPVFAAFCLWISNEWYYQSMGRFRQKGLLLTGLVGTPIHEISHAFVVTLFGMRVTSIAYYRPDFESGTLGYVTYAYNPKSAWHQVGIVFVGLSPLLAGAYVVHALFSIAGLPQLQSFLTSNLTAFHWADIGAWIQALYASVDTAYELGIIVIASMIGAHASPSKADMAGTLKATIPILILLIGISLTLHYISFESPQIKVWAAFALNHLGVNILQVALISLFMSLFLGCAGNLLKILPAMLRR
jgi:hypothetical protein